MGSTSKNKTLLKDIAYNKIKQAILEEKYQPGIFISESDLIEVLNMSKTPIKTAIVRLETEEFVTVSSKRGVIVNDLSIKRINDIYNLRIALESFNCERIYNKISSTQLKMLEKNLSETSSILPELNVRKFAELDHAFHQIISELADNQEINKILTNNYDHLLRITLRHLNSEPERMKKFYKDHRDILDSLENHDNTCVQLMRDHLEDSKVLLFK